MPTDEPKPAPRQAELDAGEEAALLGRLRAGEERAFEALVERNAGHMLAAARRILRSDEEAQDAVQDAFLSAFKALERFQGEARLGTWLHRIAIRAALMRLRAQRRREEQEIEVLLPRFKDGDGHHEVSPREWADAADGPALAAESRALVRAMIERLPDSHRVALVLRDIEEMSNDEVAERLGVSANAAKIRVHRARQALRTLLDPHFGGSAS